MAPMATVLFDDEGKANIREILGAVADTEFAQEGLQRLLEHTPAIEDWRIGEAIAETYLTDHRACCFPWPDGRDERKRGSSLPGADLVGFAADANGHRMAFGEVKTSSDQNHPPSTMYGLTGLKKQLEDLRDDQAIRNTLVVYLTHRTRGAPWREEFENAAARYLADPTDFLLLGFLVRDVQPHEDDLKARTDALGSHCPTATEIELLALYLPNGRIEGIGTALAAQLPGTAP